MNISGGKIKLFLYLEKQFEAAVETCSVFCALVKEEKPNLSEQPEEIAYVSDQLSMLNERRRRCLGLVDIRKLKVQQFIQLLTCEQDANQVSKSNIIKTIKLGRRMDKRASKKCTCRRSHNENNQI